MGLLDSNSQKFLVESMRNALIKSVASNTTLTEAKQIETVKFVTESATYEQLLNITLNPLHESKYLPTHVLEGAVAIVSEAMLTGRKVIGVNALTEGAMNLIKKTDCVVTEAMMDAADQIAQGKGIYVVAEAHNLGWTKAWKSLKKAGADVMKAFGKSAKAGGKKGEQVAKKIAKSDAAKKVIKAADSVKKVATKVGGEVTSKAKKAGEAVSSKAKEVKGKVDSAVKTYKKGQAVKKGLKTKAAKAADRAARNKSYEDFKAGKSFGGAKHESFNVIAQWHKAKKA